jgi:hypothetical protein
MCDRHAQKDWRWPSPSAHTGQPYVDTTQPATSTDCAAIAATVVGWRPGSRA